MENEDYICGSCGTEFTLIYEKQPDSRPEYCPFCAANLKDEDDLDWNEDFDPYENSED